MNPLNEKANTVLSVTTTGDSASTEMGQGRLAAPSAADGDENEELSAFLSLVQYDTHYRVDEVLKESPSEVTQKVMFVADNGTEQGPYIRKYLKMGQGIGSVYREIYQAQQNGAQFAHLPKIHALYQLKDEFVVVMDFVQGETLQEVVYRCDPSLELAMEVFPQICDAVRELHERFDPPVIHRDLKPANLILSWHKVTLIDFGIARTYREGGDADTTHFGTRAYAPPEQFGFGQTDVRSDVYALGMLLFYCLTERTAQAKDREAGFADASVPEEFRAVVAKACAFDPSERFSSVAELRDAFAKAAAAYQKRAAEHAAPSLSVHRSVLSGETASAKAGSTPGGKLAALMACIPVPVGMAWNVVLWLSWLLVAAVCVTSCFWPSGPMPEVGYPLWFRVVEYLVFFLPSATCIAYELSDKRLLWRKFPALHRWPLWAEFLVVAVVVPFVLALVMTIFGKVAALY